MFGIKESRATYFKFHPEHVSILPIVKEAFTNDAVRINKQIEMNFIAVCFMFSLKGSLSGKSK
jgi:hypothetical protein